MEKKVSVRQKRANKRAVIIAVIVTAIFVIFFAIRIIDAHQRSMAEQQKKAVIASLLQEEREKAASLQAESGQSLSEEEIIELVRLRYGLMFEDEIMFIPEE